MRFKKIHISRLVLALLSLVKCNSIYTPQSISKLYTKPYNNLSYNNISLKAVASGKRSYSLPSDHHQNIIAQVAPEIYGKTTTRQKPSTSTERSFSKNEAINLDSSYSSAGTIFYNSDGSDNNSGVGNYSRYKCEYNAPPKLPELSDDYEHSHSIVARIHKAGFQGYVLFSVGGYLDSGNVSIRSLITHSRTHGLPIKEAFSWRIYNLHSIDSNGACAPFLASDDLLHDLTALFGPIITGRLQSFSSEEFLGFTSTGHQTPQGLASLMGKTLQLIGAESNIKICVTLLPAGDKSVYEAKLHNPIAGRFKIVQATGLPQVAVMTEFLMYSNGERKESKHKWQIVDASGAVSLDPEKLFADRFHNEQNSCADLKGKFVLASNEINENNYLVVNTEMPTLRGRSSHVVSSIRPLGDYSSLYLIVYDSTEQSTDKVLACAPITLRRPITASATLKYPPVFGTISFTQESPLDPTQIQFSLNMTSPSAYFYGIDTLPSIKRRKPESKRCPNIHETIFNPLRLDVENIPFEGQGTTDQYAIGDLSGKFCSLTYLSSTLPSGSDPQLDGTTPIKSLNLATVDYNLPLFGRNSIIGRALVFYDLEGNAVSCANVELLGGIINTAYSTFDRPIQGQFIFRQLANQCDDDTFVYIEISKPDTPNAVRTDNHAWHIHERPVKTGFETLSTSQCSATGGHHNPYNVSASDQTYLRDCNSMTPERCERGDTSSKLSPISIVPYKPVTVYMENGEKKIYGDPEVYKVYLVDNSLSLCGPNSIIGRSVVVHEKHFSAPRLSCSNILEFKTKN